MRVTVCRADTGVRHWQQRPLKAIAAAMRDAAAMSSVGDSLGVRTQDPNIKSVVLYLLS